MKIRSGIDMVEISRISRLLESEGDAFVKRCFTEGERAYCDSLKGRRRDESYAARFAAKEAASKALGTGVMTRGISLKDFEVVRGGEGAPELVLGGVAKEVASSMKISSVSVSLTHEKDYAAAVCQMISEAGV